MRRYCLRIVSIFLALSITSSYASPQDIVLGVLEDVPGTYVGDSNSWHVRATFHKTQSGWQAFPSSCPDQSCLKSIVAQYPAEISWTFGLDDKILGKVTTQTPRDFELYSHIGLQNITSGSVPTLGKRSSEFGGFTDAEVYRPLVANSQPYFKDPDLWKPAPKSDDLTALLRGQFRKKYPRVSNCRSPEENVAKVWQYRDEDIKIEKTYSSNKGWFIASIQLQEYRCDGPSDDAFVEQLFEVNPERQVSFLGAGMILVDAGDYDNDGKSELLFSITDYNRGGYKLFYDKFTKSVEFKFNYH